jgi:hypothetical protein
VNHAWTARVQLPDADPWAKADTIFDGSALYVSTRDNKSSVTGNPRESDLYEIPYLGNGSWGAVSGPTAITTSSIETLTIAEDSTRRVWATFELGGNIRVGYKTPTGTAFTFFTVSKTKVNSDDISTIAAFGGNRIGVVWSDQNAKQDFFAWHLDSDAPQSNWTIETAYGAGVGNCPTANSTLCADDHLNMKVYGDQVYVAIKTSLNNTAGAPNDPLIVLLRRSSGGTWSAFPVSTVGQDATRPITVLSPSQNAIWVWAARSGEIDVWESPFTAPSFTSSAFTTWIKSSSSLDDPTSTRQVTTGATGTVVEASIKSKNQYWHNEFLASSGPPTGPAITGFSPTSGPVGTAVTITGSGFTGASSVRFHGTSASFTVNSDTSISATVPSGATTGPISVTVGADTATSSSDFIVTTGGGSSTISEVQKKHAGTSGTSLSATLPAPPTTGNVIVAVVAVAQGSNVSFDTPIGWTEGFTPNRGDVFYKVSDGTEQTVTVNLSAGQSSTVLRMWVVELSGVDTTTPFDQGNSAIFTSQTTSVTPTTGVSTAQANEWAIAMVAQNGDNGTSTGGAAATDGFTLLSTGQTRDIAASKVLSSAGTISTTISWVTPRTGSWIIATFRAA